MVEIWTHEKAEFHGEFVDFDPIYSWPKPATQPYPPLYIGGGSANYQRIARLGAGWLSMSPSADALAGQLQELRAVAGHDVPVINVHMGEPKAKDLERYGDLKVEHILVELPTEARDQTLRRLDELQSEFAQLG
jgi:alkanesulfonate monooxygenase SsuD/methylene tetrahydromethanopterin reductase-like flavin-dependent oxidoreductase (luciferase family)